MTTKQTLTEITDRRLSTTTEMRRQLKDISTLAGEQLYGSALIRADGLVAEAKRLRQRIELEKLAHERLEEGGQPE